MPPLTGLAESDVPLGLLPGGTGNLLARNLDIPQRLDEALEVALSGATRRIDVGDIGDRCFVVMAGMGLDAAMVQDAPKAVKKRFGWAAYVVSGAKHLTDRRMRVDLRLDDGKRSKRVLARTIVVGNVGTLQGGIPLLLDAEPDDGVLDIAVVAPRGLGEWVSVAVRVITRRRQRRPSAGVLSSAPDLDPHATSPPTTTRRRSARRGQRAQRLRTTGSPAPARTPGLHH